MNKVVLILIISVAITLLVCMCKKNNNETFVTTGGMQNIGSVNYDLVNDDQSIDAQLSAPDFADLVDTGENAQQSKTVGPNDRPIERLARLQDSYMPRIASAALPFSQAAAKPLVHSFSTTAPRVNLKGKLYEMNLSEAVRGSVYINYDPNVCLIQKTRYGPSDSYNTGFVTPAFDSLYSKLSGSYKNLPMYTAGSSQAGGLGGNGIEVIMDQ